MNIQKTRRILLIIAFFVLMVDLGTSYYFLYLNPTPGLMEANPYAAISMERGMWGIINFYLMACFCLMGMAFLPDFIGINPEYSKLYILLVLVGFIIFDSSIIFQNMSLIYG